MNASVDSDACDGAKLTEEDDSFKLPSSSERKEHGTGMQCAMKMRTCRSADKRCASLV